MPHNEDYFNFLVEKALMKYDDLSSGYSYYILHGLGWGARRPPCSNEWLNGYPVDMVFYTRMYECRNCFRRSCYAMFLSIEPDYLNSTGFESCSQPHKQVCISDGDHRFKIEDSLIRKSFLSPIAFHMRSTKGLTRYLSRASCSVRCEATSK